MSKTYKLFPESQAGITLGNDSVRLNGKDSVSLTANSKGITLNGPVSFASGSNQMNFSILWKMNREPMLMIPSTTATPTPVMMFSPPVDTISFLMGSSIGMAFLFGSLVG